MPRKSLQGRTCGVSRDGGRARTLQPSCRSADQGPAAKLQTSGSGSCNQVTDQPPSSRRPVAPSAILRRAVVRQWLLACARAQRPSRRRLWR
ncbi:hypothetical protein XarjCFBP7653_05575 [Xanthomonas arboricola]|nr:hypothetical protein XarjCFBP7653_05575 [Xanthomonas arboricola]